MDLCEMLIQGCGLKKTYRMGANEVQALRGVDLEVDHGEFMAIMGASGSGKSTLLNLLGCLDRPSGGSYRLDGVAAESLSDLELSRLRNKKIGFVFQSFNLIPQHNVLENVELPLIYGGVLKRIREERSFRILEQVGLGNKVHHKPTELSGGEAQRAAIARALAVEPVLLIADEPTGNLDSQTGAGIMHLFTQLNRRGTTIVMVTHSKDIASYAGRVIEMKDGQLVRDSGRARAVPVVPG
jgi:putative ABC transport system ATP-binding protein